MISLKFVRAQIFGFGKWVDQTLHFDSAPFVCLYGKNEAGKSTLQQFFLYMLFGMPPRERNRYKPKESNRFGGSLTLEVPNIGEVTLERTDGDFRLYYPDGKITEDEKNLASLLQEVSKESFLAIYAFSSLDLFELHKLKREQVSDLLFSVSVTGSSSVYKVEKDIEKKLDELFKPSGRKPLVNRKLIEVSQLGKKVSHLQKEQASYRDHVGKSEALKAEIESLQRKMNEGKEYLRVKENIVQFTPQIRSLYEREEELRRLASKDFTFPEKGLERYENLKQQLIPLKASLQSVTDQRDTYRQRLAEKKQNRLLEEEEEKLYDLLKLEQSCEEKKVRGRAIAEEIRALEAQQDSLLASFFSEPIDANQLQLPFYAKATWQQIIEEKGQLDKEEEDLEEEALSLRKKYEKLKDNYQNKGKNSLDKDRLALLREEVQEKRHFITEASSLKTIVSWEKERQKRLATWSMLSLGLILFFFVLNVLTGVTAYGVMGGLFFLLFFFQRYSLRQVKKKITTLTRRLAHYRDDYEELPRLEKTLEQAEELYHERLALEQALKEVQIERLQLEEKKEHLQRKREAWKQKVTEERKLYPFLENIEVPYWLELFDQLEKVQKLSHALGRLRVQGEEIEAEVVAFKEKETSFLEELRKDGRPITARDLPSLAREQEALKEQIKEEERRLGEVEEDWHRLKEKEALLLKERDHLFSIAQVEDEEAYYEKAQQLEHKADLESSCTALRNQLKLIFPTEALEDLYRQTLDTNTLQAEVEALQETVDAHEQELYHLHEKLASVQADISRMESTDRYSEIVHRYHLSKGELESFVAEWARMKLASQLVKEAKLSFQKKFLTKVMERTSDYFSFLTEGRYIRVFPPTETLSFQVEAKNKIRYTVEELSKGTIDQLYVALRLAISQVMKDQVVLPLIIDDAFVHFDEDRTCRALQLIESLATDQQILLLTCRRSIKRLLQEQDISHRKIELSRT